MEEDAMRANHGRQRFYIAGEGVHEIGLGGAPSSPRRASALEQARMFRFSRMAPVADAVLDRTLLAKLARAMTGGADGRDSDIPAGFTYLGQFVAHDMSFDRTRYLELGQRVGIGELVQARSPALDLDCIYGRGPALDPAFYEDGLRLRIGRTAGLPSHPHSAARRDLDGFDLPRSGTGSTRADRRRAVIPDPRND